MQAATQKTTSVAIDETLERLCYVQGVTGVLIFDKEGGIVNTTLDATEAAKYAASCATLLQRAADAVADERDSLSMLSVRTKKHELLLSRADNGEYGILVVQNPYVTTRQDPHSAKELRKKCERLGIIIPRGADRQEVLELLESEMMKRGM
uniref:Roadblock/LAMTOR2 domain-containing protein n=1 Tax=Chrysotila carterae TaxID=13221 RepID=A0A7S4B095_CHRCT|mmetsp:Transcript_21490/g.41894  ORF Transcript_21490/g.41894 Transcript_21490/m.41894 type:complete len:151 (+) Transcript_21490:290-742(+)